MEEDFLKWHNEILENQYENERATVTYYEQERTELLQKKWIVEDRLRIAESFIPLNRVSEYMEAAYGKTN